MDTSSSLSMNSDIQHVVTATTIPHRLDSTLTLSLSPSTARVVTEIRRCFVAGLVCWTVVSVTRCVLSYQRFALDKTEAARAPKATRPPNDAEGA